MVALTNQGKDVVDRFQQLPPERQRYVMLAMLRTDPDRWQRYHAEGEERLRQLAFQRGLNWDGLTDEQREDFINDLLHQDRS